MTQDETSYRAKGQAIFFAAIMVLSMVAASAAVGPAAAVSVNTGFSPADPTAGAETTHSFNASINNTDNVTSDQLQNITIDYTADADVDAADALTDGISAANITQLDVNGSQSSNIGNVVASGSTLVIELDNPINVSDTDSLNATFEGVTNPDTVKNHDVDVTLSDTNDTGDSATFSLQTAPSISVEPTEAVAGTGENVTYTATLTNGSGDPVSGETVEYTAGPSDGVNGTGDSITTDSNGEAAFEIANNSEGSFGLTFTEGTTNTNTVDADLLVTDQSTAFIDGDIGDTQLNPIQNDGDITLTVTDTDNSTTIVDEVQLSDLDTLASNNAYVESAGFTPGDVDADDRGEYFLELNTAGQVTYNFEADLSGFDSFDGDVTVGPGEQADRNIRLTRQVDADDLNVVEPNDPTSVDLESDFDATVEVQTEDTQENGLGNLAPFEGEDVTASNVTAEFDNPNDAGASLDISPVTNTTDADGQTKFNIGLNLVGSADEYDEDITAQIQFDAATSSESDTLDVTFVAEPPTGDGYLSGDVDELSNDLPVGAQSENAGAAEDVTVHAVTMNRVAANTDTVNASAGTDYARVVNSTSGEVLDVQTDYLITPDNVSLTANTSLPETGFNVVADSNTSTNFSVHVLEAGDYTIETSSNGTFTAPSEQNFTATNDLTYDATEDRYTEVSADHTDVTGADGEFLLANLYTNGTTGVDYAVIAADGNGNLGFANSAGYDTGVTVEQASAPGQDDVALAVQQIEVEADAVDIENVGLLDNASEADDEYADSLSEFENTSDDVRQVIPRDGSNVDVIDVSTFLEEGGDELGANVTLTYINTSGNFDGAFLDAAVNGSVVSHSADEITVNTEDGNAVVFLETDDAALNNNANVTIDAEMENAGGTDSTDKLFEGVLDQQYQSGSITGVVSDANDNPVDADIYVNELVDEDAGASVTFEPDDVDDLNNFTATVYDDTNPSNGNVVETVNLTAEEMRNFEFQNFNSDLSLASGEESFNLFADRAADRTTLSPVPAVAADPGVSLSLTGVSQTGETGSSVSTAIEVNRTSTGSIVIQGVDDASFAVDNLEPEEYTAGADEVFNVSADVTNNGDLSGTQDIELRLNGSAADSQSLSLDAGATETVTFEVDASTLDAGTYEHSIASEDDEVTGTLTVEEADNSTESPVDGVTQEQFDAVLPNGTDTTLGELRASVGDWSDDEQVDGVDVTLGELRAIVDYWAANQ